MNAQPTKVMLITGSTEGVGRATAEALAQKGHRLLLHGRDAHKLADVLSLVMRQGAAKGSRAVLADFGELAQVRKMAQEIRASESQLDVVVNNAGAMFSTRKTTADGLEANFGINHLAPMLLTLELLPLVNRATGRIVTLSSVGYKQAKPNFDDLQHERAYSMQPAYFNSKLFSLYFALSLADRLPHGPTSNAVHPGGVRTQLARDFKGPMKWLFGAMMPLFFLTPQQGADTSVFLADDSAVSGLSGQYWVKRKAESLTAIGANKANRERLWQISSALLAEKASFSVSI
jgi:NAD(P)-dependent dehydrogenase (short-subunit alcohol dehydrogenase family)